MGVDGIVIICCCPQGNMSSNFGHCFHMIFVKEFYGTELFPSVNQSKFTLPDVLGLV